MFDEPAESDLFSYDPENPYSLTRIERQVVVLRQLLEESPGTIPLMFQPGTSASL